MSEITKANENLFSSLSEDEKKNLSTVLFNLSSTRVNILDKERALRPLPIKFAKQIHALLSPFTEKLQKAASADQIIDINNDLTACLTDACKIIADFYKFDDIKADIESELLSLTDLQLLAHTQAQLNGSNDFLLLPLRLVINLMQMHEIVAMKLQNTSTTALSSRN